MKLRERAMQIAHGMLLAASVAVGLGCGGGEKAAKPSPPSGLEIVGAGVAADPALADTLRARTVTLPRSPVPNLRASSTAFEIDAETQPDGPVRVALPLTAKPSDDDFLVAMVADTPDGPWTPVPATATPDGRYAQFQAPHFSFFWIGRTSVRELISAVKDLFDSATGGAYQEAKHPRCPDESGARTDGFSISSEGPDTLKWCFGRDSQDRRVLRIANARRYYLMLRHPGAKTIEKATSPFWNSTAVTERISPGLTALPPRQSVAYSVKGAARVQAEFDGLAQSLYALDIGTELAVNFLTKFGGGQASTRQKLANDVFGSAQCVRQLNNDPGDGGALIRQCFGIDQLGEAFGAKGVLVGTFMLVSGVAEFFRSELNALGDLARGRDKYAIRVRRAQPPVLGDSDFVNGGDGWGTVAPQEIFNGGSPGGLAREISWTGWGQPTATGRGKMSLYRPEGNYYPTPGTVEFEATRLATCPGSDQRAYTRLRIRSPKVPGGQLGPWHLWALDMCDYDAEPQRCQDVAGTPQTDDVTTEVTAWDTDCPTAERIATAISDKAHQPTEDQDEYRAQHDGFDCVGYEYDSGLPYVDWTCLRGTQRVAFKDY